MSAESEVITQPLLGLGLWWLLPFFLFYVAGIWAGSKQKITVYRNYYDVLITGALYLVPSVFLLFMFLSDEQPNALSQQLVLIPLVLELLLFLLVLFRTWQDNRNPLCMLLALYVKIPTAIFFMFMLYGVFNDKNRMSRRKSAFWLLIISPLIYALVADKDAGKELKGKLRSKTRRT